MGKLAWHIYNAFIRFLGLSCLYFKVNKVCRNCAWENDKICRKYPFTQSGSKNDEVLGSIVKENYYACPDFVLKDYLRLMEIYSEDGQDDK